LGEGFRGEVAAEPCTKVKALVDEWDARLKNDVAAGNIAATRYDRMIQTLRHFAAFIGETADINVIDAETLEGFYHFCLEKIAQRRGSEKAGWSPSHTKQVFSVAKQWISWLSERGTIPIPSNIRLKWRFGPTVRRI
jgi:hypothetical protein